MWSDNQQAQSLNLSVNYVSHWTYLQAFREIYQNFMDACIEKHPQHKILIRKDEGTNIVTFTQALRKEMKVEEINGNKITYNSSEETLTFENDKSFPIKCLLMGCSEKGPEALGKFGEGMKVSMIVLLVAKLNIRIESGDIQYYPTAKQWGKNHNQLFVGKYDKNVLYVDIRSKTFQEKTKVTIQKVTPQMFEQFLYLSLALLSPSKYEKLTFGKSTLIFPKDEKLIGKIYKKGVRLELHESKNSVPMLYYAYDLDEVQVGRDRDCVNNVWDLYRLQSILHSNVILKMDDETFLQDNPVFRQLLDKHLKNVYQLISKCAHQVYYLHNYTAQNHRIADILYREFLIVNKLPKQAQFYPTYNTVIAHVQNILMIYGLDIKFYPSIGVCCHLWSNLKLSSRYISIDDKMTRDIFSKQSRELTANQLAILGNIKIRVAHVAPQVSEYNFKVKLSDKIKCCKDKDTKNKLIFLSPEYVAQQNFLTREICRILLTS